MVNVTYTPTVTLTLTPTHTLTPTPNLLGDIKKGIIEEYYSSADGSMLIFIQDTNIYWLDAQTGGLLGSKNLYIDSYGMEIVISPDNSWIIVRSYADKKLINTQTGNISDVCNVDNTYNSQFRFSLDISHIAFVVNKGSVLMASKQYDTVGVYNLESEGMIVLEAPTDLITHIWGIPAIHPENRIVAVGDFEAETNSFYLVAWDVSSGDLRYKFQYNWDINTIDFSPDGQYLATGSDDGYIRLHDPETGDWIRSIRGFPGAISKIRFTEDSSAIVVSFWDYPNHYYDLNTDEIKSE